MKNKNTGYKNTGYKNTGYRNAGDKNTGYWNTGDSNTGFLNTGYRNVGDRNTGSWNTGDSNTGFLNTDKPKLRIFNKDTEIKREDIEFPEFFFYELTEWIPKEDMSDKEKEDYPSYATCGGYLKSYTDKQAWRNSWDKADIEDRRKCLNLPNWDNELFKEISGIDVEKELNSKETIEIGGIKYDKEEVEDRLKDIKPIN